MDSITRERAIAAGKIGVGAARIVSSLALAAGHGVIGAWLRNHGRMAVAANLARRGFEAGKDLVEEGLADWKRASAAEPPAIKPDAQ